MQRTKVFGLFEYFCGRLTRAGGDAGSTSGEASRGRQRSSLAALAVWVAVLAGVLAVTAMPAYAAPQVAVDEQGANDEPNQKDLTQHAVDSSGLPTSIDVSWSWDEIDFSGANTGDACALFDTDQDARVNFAVCVTVEGDPAVQASVSPRLYVCGDDKVDRCTQPVTSIPSFSTTCSVSQTDTDPFGGPDPNDTGDGYPTDTTASCHVILADVGGTDAKLINTCSYPSEEPNSDPSDCVLIPRDGFIVIVKDANPDDSSAEFDFTLDGDSTPVFTAHGSETSSPIAVRTDNGTHALAESALPSGWQLDGASCDDGSAVDAIDVQSDETVTCTFHNSRLPSKLTVIKHVIKDSGGTAAAGDFTMSVSGVNPSSSSFPGAESPGTTVTLDPGSYSVSESGPAGYAESDSADCSGSIAAGEEKTCTITNDDISPTLTVNKTVVPVSDSGLFNLRIDGATAGTGANAGDGGTTGAVPVLAGAHTVSETAGTNTTLSDYISAIGGDCATNGSITLALGQNKTCTITNTKKATVTVTKTENGAAPKTQYTFRLSGGPDNVSINRTTGVDDNPVGSGNLAFGKVKPGSGYTLCELLVPAGTTSSLQALPGATVDSTTGDVCVTFALTAGQQKTFAVDNVHPLGGQRTIGYWKNWNRCAKSSGNQVQNAAKTGHALVDDLLPITLGSVSANYAGVTVSTCVKAVEILGAASSKYAEHGLAAQLLAAKLNKKVAGNQACTAANSAIQQADDLLAQIKWSGAVNTQIISDKHALRSQFVSTTAQLDKFNNEKLC
jgi:hypothetical protein